MANIATTTSLETLMVDTVFNTATTNLADKCITHAEEKFIKPILAKRYDISGWTAGTTPPSIISMSEEIAMGLMYKYMSRGSKTGFERANQIIDPVMKQLEMIADHKAELFDTSGSIVNDKSTGAFFVKSNTQDFHPVFDLDSPTNWTIDSDQLEDIANERG